MQGGSFSEMRKMYIFCIDRQALASIPSNCNGLSGAIRPTRVAEISPFLFKMQTNY